MISIILLYGGWQQLQFQPFSNSYNMKDQYYQFLSSDATIIGIIQMPMQPLIWLKTVYCVFETYRT